MTTLGQRLRTARKATGMKLVTVRDRCGISVSHLSDMERDVNKPSLDTLTKLACAYGVPVASLIAETLGTFRADATTVRRAVLRADLTAMCDALEDGSDEERRIAAILHTLSAAIIDGKVKEMEEQAVNMAIGWLGELWRQHEAGKL